MRKHDSRQPLAPKQPDTVLQQGTPSLKHIQRLRGRSSLRRNEMSLQ